MVRHTQQLEPAVTPLDVRNALALNAQTERELETLVATYDIHSLGKDDAHHHYLLTVALKEAEVLREFLETYRRFTHS